jgi:hypothetical protein
MQRRQCLQYNAGRIQFKFLKVEASFKILCTIGGFYTHLSLSNHATFRPGAAGDGWGGRVNASDRKGVAFFPYSYSRTHNLSYYIFVNLSFVNTNTIPGFFK